MENALCAVRGPRMLRLMSRAPLQKLYDLIETLRGEKGCPWDREQQAEDILSDLIEECHELQWAHATSSPQAVLDETGDVIFVLTFALALLEEKYPAVTLEKAVTHAYEKIYRRHPHVFGDAVAHDKTEGLAHWEAMKARERESRDGETCPFDDIPASLPPVRRAEKIQKRAARAGFDWKATEGILEKIREEIAELEESLDGGSADAIEDEVGDLLFSIVNLTRFLHIDAEKALTRANAKFIDRYQNMRRLAADDGHRFEDLDVDTMETYWQRAKRMK